METMFLSLTDKEACVVFRFLITCKVQYHAIKVNNLRFMHYADSHTC